jgi:hypothetical protein
MKTTERKALIRLAAALPKGSEERRAILAAYGRPVDLGVDPEITAARVEELRKENEKRWKTKDGYSVGPWDPELSKFVGHGGAFRSTTDYFKSLQKSDGTWGEAAPFAALSKADRLSLIRERIAPGLDLSSLTDAAIIHLLLMGGKYPTAKSQPDLPSKGEIKKLERAALKENRAAQREIKGLLADLDTWKPKNPGTALGREWAGLRNPLARWMRLLEAEVKTLKNPPTPAGAAKSSANFEQALGAMTVALADPSMKLADLFKMWKKLVNHKDKTETAFEVQSILGGEGVAQRYRREQDKTNSAAKALEQKKEEETQQVEERKKKMKARPRRPPVSNSPSHPIFKKLPRIYKGLANVTRQRLMALLQDMEDAKGRLPSDDARMEELEEQGAYGSIFYGGTSGMTLKETAEYRKLMNRAQPKRWLTMLIRNIERANAAVKLYESIRRPTRWDDQQLFEFAVHELRGEMKIIAREDPAVIMALGRELGWKWPDPKTIAKGGGSRLKGGWIKRPKSRENNDIWDKHKLTPTQGGSRYAATSPEDKARLNKATKNILQKRIDEALKGFEKWVAKLYLNDLGKAYNQVRDLEGVFNTLVNDIRDEYGDYVSRSDYIDFYEELDDGGFYGMEVAIEEVEHDLNEMIGNGWADDGYEDQVQEEIEDQILPRFEDALDTFRSEFGKVPRV